MMFLGIDWGERKVGVAIGSDEVKVASPFIILQFGDSEKVIDSLVKIVNEENIEAFVVGQPKSLAGNDSQNKKYTDFIDELKGLGLPVHFEDERFSTSMFNSVKKQYSDTRGGDDDSVAAAVILQSYLDRI